MASKRWKKIRHTIEYRSVVFLCRLFGRLSLKAVLRTADLAGWLIFHVFRVRRGVVLSNLRLAFPEMSEAERKGIARRSYQNMGKMTFEWLHASTASDERIRTLILFDHEEYFDWTFQNGRGAILLSGHFGNWELMAAAIAKRGHPLSVVAAKQRNRRVDGFINELRASSGIRVIRLGMAIRGVLRALANNELVAILGDQDAHREGVFVNFFGRPASTHQGPAALALKTGAPIILGSAVRLPDGRHRVLTDRLTVDHLKGASPENIRAVTQAHVSLLEKRIRQFPDHWFWMHRRWKTRPPSERSIPEDETTARREVREAE